MSHAFATFLKHSFLMQQRALASGCMCPARLFDWSLCSGCGKHQVNLFLPLDQIMDLHPARQEKKRKQEKKYAVRSYPFQAFALLCDSTLLWPPTRARGRAPGNDIQVELRGCSSEAKNAKPGNH